MVNLQHWHVLEYLGPKHHTDSLFWQDTSCLMITHQKMSNKENFICGEDSSKNNYKIFKGYGHKFCQILFFCFYYLQCFGNAFLMIKWNLRVSDRVISQRQDSQYLSCKQDLCCFCLHMFNLSVKNHFWAKLWPCPFNNLIWYQIISIIKVS